MLSKSRIVSSYEVQDFRQGNGFYFLNKQIQTYPHHKHLGEEILASDEITLEYVLKYIETFLEKKSHQLL